MTIVIGAVLLGARAGRGDGRRHDPRRLGQGPLRARLPADQPRHLRLVPAGRRDRVPRGRRRRAGSRWATPASTCSSSASFIVALAIDFVLIAGYSVLRRALQLPDQGPARPAPRPALRARRLDARARLRRRLRQAGTAAVALLSVVILVFQYVVGALLVSQDRADELELRARQLAGFQVALLSALLRTLDLRDRMTARHSAAVARYSREIAAHVGMSAEDQELVHSAGLLHDIGKFVLPDNILKSGRRKLTDAEWEAIKTHPYEGARIVSQIDGYQPIGEIILAHHERIDGKGYPRGLSRRRDPRAGEDRLGRRHLRRDDRPRHLPRAGQLIRGGGRDAPGVGHPARRAATSRRWSRCSTARTSPTATARTPTSRPSWRSTSGSTTTSRRPPPSAGALG